VWKNNVAKVVGATSSEGFPVYDIACVHYTSPLILSHRFLY